MISGGAAFRIRKVGSGSESLSLSPGRPVRTARRPLRLAEAVKYVQQRQQFGKPIAANQGIQWMLADMEMQVEAARCLTYHVAELIDQGQSVTVNGSIAKCVATDTAMKVCTDAVQLFGGYGYMKEYPVEKLFRDAKIFQIVEGTNQIQRIVVARSLLGK